ncbi:hypothetical protein ACS0ZG_37650 [Burkholderia gladioli]|uniref:hypothetical protein n=1 Tax=Burkholderia gladioli TaxID=28095 RepID=UPI000FD7C3E4|nr:hypothetical protein [Burkholderia gladioli]
MSATQIGDSFVIAGSTGTPGNNQAQNKQVRDVATQLGLSKDQRQQLHREISGQNLSYHEIMGVAKDLFGN